MATFAGHGSCLEIRLPGSSSDGEPSETLGVLQGQILIFGAFPEALNLGERHFLGTRRRIEITAFRRATIIFRPQAGNVAGTPPVQTERLRPVGIDSTQAGGV